METDRESLINLLTLGYCIEYKDLSLYHEKYYDRWTGMNLKFAVHFYQKNFENTKRISEYGFFHDSPEDAVDEFLRLKKEIYDVKSRNKSST